MKLTDVADRLMDGEAVEFKPHGNSMTPRIHSGDLVRVEPRPWDKIPGKGRIVLAKVKGKWVLHKVLAVGGDGRVQIGNNHGHVNGWALMAHVVGVVTEVNGKEAW